MGNDFEPAKMVGEHSQDLRGVHREVIYDRKDAVKRREGAQATRLSENTPRAKAELKPGKSQSVSTKVEHRAVIKGGDAENFGSSKR